MAGRQPAPGADVSGPHLTAVANALAGRRRLRFRYRPLQGRAGFRRVDPYALLFRRGAWYLVGLDADRRDVRSYRLSRIRSDVEDAGEAGPAPAAFEASRYLEGSPLGDGGSPGSRRARVSFSDKVGWLVAASTRGARVGRTRRDGWVEIDVPTDDPEGLASWVLSFGADARALSPRSLRDEVVRRLESLSADRA
jgi:predicted DNA-binding transcriptional regulator YafY